MNVVDSSAWLSYFAGDKNASTFSEAIENIDKLLVPSITITEVFKNIFRQRDEESALAAIAHMEQGRVISLDSELAIYAASYGLAHKLPLADSIIFATAQKYSATLWTQDSDFKGLSNVRFYPKAEVT
jgi:predicted nucleic acid-binding protein